MQNNFARVSDHIAAGPVLREADALQRLSLEAFVSVRFAEVYDAQLYSFMPQLFGLYEGECQRLIAAFGLRAADQQPLFLERYLDEPIEAHVARRRGVPVSRRRIVEVGNLAGATHGALRELIPLLCELLHARGFEWVTFTGSAGLCNSFSRLGLPLSVVAEAPVDRLSPEERRRWGRYYDRSPSVMLGNIRQGRERLRTTALGELTGEGAP